MIGALYAEFFASRVGLVVLDSAVLPDAPTEPRPTQQEVDASARSWAYEFDDVVDDFVTDCGSSIECPLGKDTPTVSRNVVSFLDRLDKRPMGTTFESLPRLTEGWAVTAISNGLDDRDSWPYLVDALDAAMNGDDPDDLADFAMTVTQREVDGTYAGTTFDRSHLLVTCADWPPSPWDSVIPSPDVLANHPLWSRVRPPAPDPCDGWAGSTRQTLTVDPQVDTPVLVIGNEGDDVTPIEDTADLSAEIRHSRLVRVATDGHGAYSTGNDCADRAVDRYLAESVLPEEGLRCGT